VSQNRGILQDLWSDEPPLESDLHRDQIDQLIRLIRSIFSPGGLGGRSDVYVAGNLTIYYSPNQKKSEDFRGPDVFVVLGTDPTVTQVEVQLQQEQERSEALAAKLRKLGIDPDRLVD
jgi:Uma2 family endonuclease